MQNKMLSFSFASLAKLKFHSFGPVFSNGTNFCVSITFPAIFSFPFINASCGLILPSAISTKSSSLTVSVVSALTPFGAPSYSFALFKSIATKRKNIVNNEKQTNDSKRLDSNRNGHCSYTYMHMFMVYSL